MWIQKEITQNPINNDTCNVHLPIKTKVSQSHSKFKIKLKETEPHLNGKCLKRKDLCSIPLSDILLDGQNSVPYMRLFDELQKKEFQY